MNVNKSSIVDDVVIRNAEREGTGMDFGMVFAEETLKLKKNEKEYSRIIVVNKEGSIVALWIHCVCNLGHLQ